MFRAQFFRPNPIKVISKSTLTPTRGRQGLIKEKGKISMKVVESFVCSSIFRSDSDNYPNLVRKFLKLLDKEFPWFKPLPIQFHRLNHNFNFMVNDRNSLGRKSLEGLEQGNYTTQLMDAHQTFKGDRKKANRGVFKLLRLKSSRILRQYRKKPPTRKQRCSRC